MDIENESKTMKVLEYKEMKLYFIMIVLWHNLKSILFCILSMNSQYLTFDS